MEVNIKKYNCVEKGIIKLNDASLRLINIIRKESVGINIYYINHFYLEDNNIKQRPFILVLMMFMVILKKIMVRNI